MATTIVRWNPLREMAAMQSALDRMLDESWRTSWPTYNGGSNLALDVHETDNAYLVTAALSGLSADQINIRFENGTLTIRAEIPQPQTQDNVRVLMQERSYGQFSRSITLPQSVNADQVEANYENGLLILNLPKAPEAQPKQIAIKHNNRVLQSNN